MGAFSNIRDSMRDGPSRDYLRPAWRMLVVFIVVNILLYTYSEWHNWIYSIHEDAYPFFRGASWLIFISIGAILSVKNIIRQLWVATAIYGTILFICLFELFFGRELVEIDMLGKAYLFSYFPHLCQPVEKPNAQAFVCYQYWSGGIPGTLVVNPGDEMLAPPKKWPESIKREIFGKNADVDECQIRDTKRMVGHIYYVPYRCYGDMQ